MPLLQCPIDEPDSAERFDGLFRLDNKMCIDSIEFVNYGIVLILYILYIGKGRCGIHKLL